MICMRPYLFFSVKESLDKLVTHLFVLEGGYDRGECLKTVECFDMATNTWSPMPPMLSPRGRFDVSQIDGSLFACGGSDGSTELRTGEFFESGKWKALPQMKKPRSSAGKYIFVQ